MVDFGGWDMPVKYATSIAEEHRALRANAAIFDVSHMSAVAVQGPYALSFLEVVMANTAARLVNNEAQYRCVLERDGLQTSSRQGSGLALSPYIYIYISLCLSSSLCLFSSFLSVCLYLSLRTPSSLFVRPFSLSTSTSLCLIFGLSPAISCAYSHRGFRSSSRTAH